MKRVSNEGATPVDLVDQRQQSRGESLFRPIGGTSCQGTGTTMKACDSKYWNPYLETLPRGEIREIQLKGLRGILHYAKKHSAFYRDRYKGIEPEDIRTMDDVRRLPLGDKEDLRSAQEGKEPFPFGEILGAPLEEVTTFRQTSGTTGRPVYVPETC